MKTNPRGHSSKSKFAGKVRKGDKRLDSNSKSRRSTQMMLGKFPAHIGPVNSDEFTASYNGAL